jgi:hypothetical protein
LLHEPTYKIISEPVSLHFNHRLNLTTHEFKQLNPFIVGRVCQTDKAL